MRTCAFAFLLLVSQIPAADISPVVWTHSASSQQVYVACYHVQDQFPNRDSLTDKHLVLAMRVTAWQTTAPAKREAIKDAIGKFLRGEVRITREKVQQIKAALNDANIMFALTDDPIKTLRDAGLVPPKGDGL